MEQKLSRENRIMWVLKAMLAAYALTAVLLLALTLLLYKAGIGEQEVRLGIMAVYVLSTFTGGFILGKLVKTKRFLWGLLLGVLYFLLLILISIGVYRTVQTGGNMVLAGLLCAAGGTLGGMVS